jgi:hypothetical protein
MNEHIHDLIEKSRAADDFVSSVELQPLVEDEFKKTVLLGIFEHLSAMFSADLNQATKAQMRNVFWKVTAGDWKTIARKTRDLARALPVRNGQVRYISQEILSA